MPRRVGMYCERSAVVNGIAYYDCASSYDDDTIGPLRESWVDLHTGAVHCDCPDFSYDKLKRAGEDRETPNIGTPRYHCLHLERVIADLIEQSDVEIRI